MILSGIYLFVFGESGLLERIEFEKKSGALVAKINLLKKENARLFELYKKYQNGYQSPDDIMLSGYMETGSKFLIFHGAESAGKASVPVLSDESLKIENRHLRVLWILISAAVVFLYFYMASRRHEGY